jgi:hypothetical protein
MVLHRIECPLCGGRWQADRIQTRAGVGGGGKGGGEKLTVFQFQLKEVVVMRSQVNSEVWN